MVDRWYCNPWGLNVHNKNSFIKVFSVFYVKLISFVFFMFLFLNTLLSLYGNCCYWSVTWSIYTNMYIWFIYGSILKCNDFINKSREKEETEHGKEKMDLNSLCKDWLINMALLHRKGESHTSAKYTNASAHVEISGTAGNKEHYLSILPTIVRTFGPTFFFGGILKLFHDILQFISPQILRWV